MIEYILFALFIILQIGDCWTTYQVLKLNKGTEANPVMAWLMSKLGVLQGLVIAKLVVIALFSFVVNELWPILLLFNIIYGYIVYSNYKILKG